ncbi:hypothetical protein, partial [Helicobacter kayseriensis]|uniref:hypothetical protein n=1 Tax=Helicobacter kayseriensis TaxID=2905877 RepID=UPI001E499414
MTYTKQIKDLKFKKSKKDEYTLRQEGVLQDTDKWKEILKIFDASYEKKLAKLPHSITLSKDQLSQKKKALSSILQTHFPFMITKEEAKKVLQKLIPEYSRILENRMRDFKLQKQQIQALKGSYEWIALLSLSYTNPSSLIGPKLCSALRNNDRFRAWFEIRYQSNKDKDIGLAKRRFAESNCFGLFDGYKRGEFKKTLWKQEKEFGEDALKIFESLHSLREEGKEETYLEFIRLYESGKLFKTKAFKDLNDPNDFKFHFAPYTDVFSPFAEALKQAFGFQESIKSELPLVDRILVLNTEGQFEILDQKIKYLIKKEKASRGDDEEIPSQSPLLDIYIISHQVQKSPLSITSYPQANLHFYLKDGAKIDIRPSQSQGENLFFHAFALLKEIGQQVKEWIQTFPIIGSSSQPLKSQSDALIVQGTDSEGKASPLLYSFEKEDKAYSSTLKVTTPFGDQKICFYNLPFQDYTLTQQTQQACNISLCLPTSLQSHSTDSSLQEDYQASKQSTKASKADFFIRTHHYHTKNPLSGIKLSYNKKEAITDDEGFAYFCFDIKRSWEAFRIYPILIQSEEHIAPSNITYTCSMNSCSSKQEAYHLALLKKGHASFKEMSLMFDFGDYPIKEVSIPTKDLKTFKQASGVKELAQDFFLDSVISVWQIKRNFIKIQKDRTCIARISYKKEFLTYWNTGLILDEKDFRHLQSTLESNDVDLYEFQDEQDYFYLQEISIRTSCEGKSASNEIEDTLTLKANFSKPHSKTSQTQWGYISFAKGVEILK